MTPATTSTRWFSLSSVVIWYSVWTAPALGSAAPYTSRPTRAFTISPAHMGHGSSVTASVQWFSLQSPMRLAAARMAMCSACAAGSLSISRRLEPSPTTSPESVSYTTAPTGASPIAAASLAKSSARRII